MAARPLRPQRRLRAERRAAPSAQDSTSATTSSSTTTACSTPRATRIAGSGSAAASSSAATRFSRARTATSRSPTARTSGSTARSFRPAASGSAATRSIAAYTYLVGGDHDAADRSRPVIEQGRRSAGIDVGDGAWIGAGATVLDGVTLGDRAVVGAGAVVRESVPAARRSSACPRGRSALGPRRAELPHGRHHDRHVCAAAHRRRPPRHRAIARAGTARRRTSRRHRHDAVESVRPPGPGVSGELADRRRHDRDGRAGRSGHLAAVSELRRPASPARVLARAHDARVLRPLGPVLLEDVAAGPRQGTRAACADPARRHLLLQAPRQEAVHDFRRGARSAGALESRPGRSAAPAATAARRTGATATATTCSSPRGCRRSSAPTCCCARSRSPRRAACAASSAATARNVAAGAPRARARAGRSRRRSPVSSRKTALVEHLARCRAVVFAPQNEDYGFVTVEAFAARRR